MTKTTQNKNQKNLPTQHFPCTTAYNMLHAATGYGCLIYQKAFWHGKDWKYKDTGLILNFSFEISMASVDRFSQDLSALFLG